MHVVRRTPQPLVLALSLATASACGGPSAKPVPTSGPAQADTVDLSRPDGSARPPAPMTKPKTMPIPSATPEAAAAEESGPIAEGLTTWRGMVVPTKGGFQIRDVTVEHGRFTELLFASAIDGLPSDPDWYLGAVVRVRGTVVRHADEAPDGGPIHAQRRAGSWLGASRLEWVELVKNAEQIEGVLHRSKGFFSVGKALVAPRDIGWAIAGAQEGDKVKLWGQLHVQVCDPRAQCLLEGSLPIFAVGRGKKLP